MKFYFKPVLSVLALVVLLGYAGCGPDGGDTPPIEEVQLGKLTGIWKVGSAGNVTLLGVSKKAEYADFTLTLSGTPGETTFDYSTTGRPGLSAWPASGKWSFGTNVEQDVVRDKGVADKQVDISYTVTDTGLELTFDYPYAGESGKVTGTWIFTLTK